MIFDHVDLFSGIGGFALAARWAGFKTVQFVEIDPFCQKVLTKNFPGVPIHDDIKTFHWGEVEKWQESVQTVKSARSQGKGSPIVNHATQNEFSFGEQQILKREGQVTESGAEEKKPKCSPIMEESVFVAENPPLNFSPSTIKTITETLNEKFTKVRYGKQQSNEDCQTTTKSFATTAITPKHITESVHTNGANHDIIENSIGTDGGSEAGNAFHEGRTSGKDRRESIPENSEGGTCASISDDKPATFNGNAEGIFLLTAGVPCQPASCAGKRRGTSDDRWLWEEAFRIIREAQPIWVILENVAGLLSLESGVVFDDLLSSLEGEGYETQAFTIPACAVGAPHRRDRVWIVAKSNAVRRGRGEDGEGCAAPTGNGDTLPASQDPISIRFSQRCSSLSGSESGGTFSRDTDRHATDTDAAGLQIREMLGCDIREKCSTAFRKPWDEDWIEAATRLCRVDARVSNRVDRLKSLGNAIVPQVAYEIMKAIKGLYD